MGLMAAIDPVISVRGLRNAFGDQVIHDNLDLDVRAGEILGVVGGSGTGKSVLMRSIIEGEIDPGSWFAAHPLAQDEFESVSHPGKGIFAVHRVAHSGDFAGGFADPTRP